MLEVGQLQVDPASREVRVAGEGVGLTSREFALLEYLARHADRVLTKTELLDRVWNEHFGGWQHVLERGPTIDAYQRHVTAVRREAPPDRLVEWRVTDGWASLCRQLGLDVPDHPLPHLNRRSS